jgi:secreted PhoX family phosphatase
VVDTDTGAAAIVAQRDDWEALDGIRWTPWGTLLFAEETIDSLRPDPDFPAALSGLVYEIVFEKNDPTTAKEVIARPALGSLSHEGIEVDAHGNVYVIDERAPGSIYKFVPAVRGDLSSGQLYALKVENAVTRTGVADWLPLDRNQVQIRAFAAAQAVGATGWGRPEDLEIIRGVLYVAITSEDKVLAITLNTQRPIVSNFVEAGVNVSVEGPTGFGLDTGFDSPDNLASDHAGNLWIVEDNVPSDIWVAAPDLDGNSRADSVHLFASLADAGAEGTGIYFGRDPGKLCVNVQHSASGNDKTMLIFKHPGNSGDNP